MVVLTVLKPMREHIPHNLLPLPARKKQAAGADYADYRVCSSDWAGRGFPAKVRHCFCSNVSRQCR